MMTPPRPDEIVWRTSSYTAGNGACVEVGWHTDSDENGTAAERVLVRDTKDRTAPALTFSTPAWRAFLATLTP